MNDEEIREKFFREGIADKAEAAALERVRGEKVFARSGPSSVNGATMAEIYLMGWKDAEAQSRSGKRR